MVSDICKTEKALEIIIIIIIIIVIIIIMMMMMIVIITIITIMYCIVSRLSIVSCCK